MTRFALLATLALGLAAPAQAQQTFQAWGHEFLVPGQPALPSAAPAPSRYDTLRDAAPRSAVERPARESRRLDVRGARIDAPAR